MEIHPGFTFQILRVAFWRLDSINSEGTRVSQNSKGVRQIFSLPRHIRTLLHGEIIASFYKYNPYPRRQCLSVFRGGARRGLDFFRSLYSLDLHGSGYRETRVNIVTRLFIRVSGATGAERTNLDQKKFKAKSLKFFQSVILHIVHATATKGHPAQMRICRIVSKARTLSRYSSEGLSLMRGFCSRNRGQSLARAS